MTGQSNEREQSRGVPSSKISPSLAHIDSANKPDKRTRIEARQRSESAILEAAFTEFATRGYAATRLEDIARRAGVAKGLPSFYFRRKEDLFRAVVRRLVAPTWAGLANAALESDAPTRDVLRTTLAAVYQRVVGDVQVRELIRLLIAEGPRFPELIDSCYTEVVERSVSTWRRLIDRGVARGEFSPGAASRYPQILYAPALMALIWELLFGPDRGLDLDTWLDAHLELVLVGLQVKRP